MRCTLCQTKCLARKATAAQPYRFVESGLTNVFLIGVKVWTCTYCREESAIIPNIGQLSDAVAHDLLKKAAPLDGRELRYLRKHAGFAAQDFAGLMRIDPAHLSRVECGKTRHLSKVGDTLARLLIHAAMVREETNPNLLAFARGLKQCNHSTPPTVFKWAGNRWPACSPDQEKQPVMAKNETRSKPRGKRARNVLRNKKSSKTANMMSR